MIAVAYRPVPLLGITRTNRPVRYLSALLAAFHSVPIIDDEFVTEESGILRILRALLKDRHLLS